MSVDVIYYLLESIGYSVIGFMFGLIVSGMVRDLDA